ncbi:hypothetical protein Ssi03_61440 [Sphaerisporangium siamense]|nr:hypothetical protein Ssi03_61440 [Sphaerisporangium siamense]
MAGDDDGSRGAGAGQKVGPQRHGKDGYGLKPANLHYGGLLTRAAERVLPDEHRSPGTSSKHFSIFRLNSPHSGWERVGCYPQVESRGEATAALVVGGRGDSAGMRG